MKQSLVITLLDLNNAFCEVHQNLIYEFLDINMFLTISTILLKAYALNFILQLSHLVSTLPWIPVGRGVLQVDCLSHLLFNLCFHTFIQHINARNYYQFWFLGDCCRTLIQFTGFHLQVMQLLSVVIKVKINTCLIASPFGAIGHKWPFELINVSPLELRIQHKINPIPAQTSSKL